jgi:hypothetical protein
MLLISGAAGGPAQTARSLYGWAFSLWTARASGLLIFLKEETK